MGSRKRAYARLCAGCMNNKGSMAPNVSVPPNREAVARSAEWTGAGETGDRRGPPPDDHEKEHFRAWVVERPSGALLAEPSHSVSDWGVHLPENLDRWALSRNGQNPTHDPKQRARRGGDSRPRRGVHVPNGATFRWVPSNLPTLYHDLYFTKSINCFLRLRLTTSQFTTPRMQGA